MPENLDSTFVDLQEGMQLDCFVGVKNPFAYPIQSVILMGLHIRKETQFKLVTTLVPSLCYMSNSDNKLVTLQCHSFRSSFSLFRKLGGIKKYRTKSRLLKVEHQMTF